MMKQPYCNSEMAYVSKSLFLASLILSRVDLNE